MFLIVNGVFIHFNLECIIVHFVLLVNPCFFFFLTFLHHPHGDASGVLHLAPVCLSGKFHSGG